MWMIFLKSADARSPPGGDSFLTVLNSFSRLKPCGNSQRLGCATLPSLPLLSQVIMQVLMEGWGGAGGASGPCSGEPQPAAAGFPVVGDGLTRWWDHTQ